MTQEISAKPASVQKIAQSHVVTSHAKMLDDDELKAISGLIDRASDADPSVKRVVIDVAGVSILPSLAIGLLVQILNKCRARQQSLTLASLQPQIREVFRITRMDRVFRFADSVEAATM
jgi:anti-anti-sigma factor